MRVALEEMLAVYRSHHGCCCTVGPVVAESRPKLLERFEMFVRGQWDNLLEASRVCGDKAAVARRRRRRRGDDINKRVDRAEALVHLGELSSARQALEGAELAQGSQQTLDILRDQSKRPRETRVPIPPELVHHSSQSPFNLDESRFFRNLRSAKRGAAGGPSGMTVEHLQPLHDHTKDARMFFQVSERLARAQVPPSVRDTVRFCRFTALQKPDGGVRGIVAGDVVRRLVARTILNR